MTIINYSKKPLLFLKNNKKATSYLGQCLVGGSWAHTSSNTDTHRQPHTRTTHSI